MTLPKMSWAVADNGNAMFTVRSTHADRELAEAMASEFARALDEKQIETRTDMLRTRSSSTAVEILWVGAVSDISGARDVLGSYQRAISA